MTYWKVPGPLNREVSGAVEATRMVRVRDHPPGGLLDLRLSWEFIGSASGEYGTAHSAQLASLQLLVCGGSPTDKSDHQVPGLSLDSSEALSSDGVERQVVKGLRILIDGVDRLAHIREMTLPLAFEHLIIAPTGCSLLLAMLARELWHRVEPAAQAQ